MNSRFKHDKNGEYTSEVDYCIASERAFSELLWDVDNPMQDIMSSVKDTSIDLCTSINDYELSKQGMNIDYASHSSRFYSIAQMIIMFKMTKILFI